MVLLNRFFDARYYRVGMRAADAARDQGRFGEAATLYGQLAARFPDDAGLLVLRGNMLKDAKCHADARESYAAAIARDFRNADAHLQLGHLAKLEGDFEEAAVCYRRSASIDPNRPDACAELRMLEPLILNTVNVQRFDQNNTFLMCAGPTLLLFERLKVAFANKPA